MEDRINLIYTDAAIRFEVNFPLLARFTDRLRQAAFDALHEESVLVVTSKVYHST